MLTVADMFARTSRRYPERIGCVAGSPLTYRAWHALVRELAGQYAALGIGGGDHVATVVSDGATFANTYLALQSLGAVVVPLSRAATSNQLAFCIADSRAGAVVCDQACLEGVLGLSSEQPPAVLLADRPPSAPRLVRRGVGATAGEAGVVGGVGEAGAGGGGGGAGEGASPGSRLSVILYTAGTTGEPKGVPRSQSSETLAALAHVVQAGYGPDDVVLAAMPMHHTMGLRTLLSCICIGASVVFIPEWNAQVALEAIATHGVSSLYLVPTAFYALAQSTTESLASVRKIGYAGAPMLAALSDRLSEWLRPERFVNHYGCTEVYTIAVEPDAALRPGSVGRPGLFAEVRIVVPEAGALEAGSLEPLAAGETGEVLVSLSSPEAFAGYWRRADADARALLGGWYRTGDLGYLDARGDLRLHGRTDDMIITGGENVYPIEIEECLCKVEGVGEVCVAGVEDERWGCAVTAFVTAAGEGEPRALAEAIVRTARHSSALAAHQRPKRVVVVESLPKSSAGKLLRRELLRGRFEVLAEAGGDLQRASVPGA